MKYALVILDTPVLDGGSLQALANAAADVVSISGQKSKANMLNVGCYLLPLGNGLNEFSDLVRVLKDRRIPHRALFLMKSPHLSLRLSSNVRLRLDFGR